ncbi:MAG: hypothetical protein J7M19_00945 [Planctomycetes bacterium]|nr:hypothetical protein [Planctomycetota bacterium]
MSNVSLKEILEAEKQAQEKVRRAHEEAEASRKKAADQAARTEKEVAERIETTRRERLEEAEHEIAEARERIFQAAQAQMQEWDERYGRRHDEMVEMICRILKGGDS